MQSRRRTETAVSARPSSILPVALAIFASAFFLRLVHVLQTRSSPFATVLFGDARAYDEWALRIAGGDWIGSDVFYQAPLYPYLLGIVYAVGGHDLLLVRMLQAAAGALACVLLALAADRLFNRRVAIIAGGALAVYAPAIFFDGIIQKTSLETLLISVLLYLVARLVDDPESRWSWFGAGLTLGALALSRENAMVLIPIVGVWLWREPRLIGKARTRAIVAALAGIALLLVPTVFRNAAVSGGFFLTTSQFGTNVYIGNHAGADGMYQPLRTGRGTAEFERADATDLASRAAGRALSPGEVSRYWSGRAMEFVRMEPGAWVRLMLRKLVLLVNAVEVTDTESQESYAESSWVLRVLGWFAHFGVLVPLSLLGLYLTRERWGRLWAIPAMAAAYAVSIIAFYVLARYRAPLVPFMVLFAAAGLARLLDAATHRPSMVLTPGGLIAAAAIVVAAAVTANWPILSHASMQATSETNLGVALQAEGNYDEAIAHYRRAIALRPDDPAPYLNVGTALEASKRTTEAAAMFATAAEMRPDLGEAHYFLAKTLLERGQETEAISHLRRALPRMPDSADVRTSLGVALAAQGRVDEAIPLFREVVGLTPTSATAHWNLGSALTQTDEIDEAIRELERSVMLDPSLTQARAELATARQERAHR